jgi:hypothetical protein
MANYGFGGSFCAKASAAAKASAFAKAMADEPEDGHLFFDIATKVASDV